jgi:beta-lactamase class A
VLQQALDVVVDRHPGVTWGACLHDASEAQRDEQSDGQSDGQSDAQVLAHVAQDQMLPIASVGKLLLLVEVARRLSSGQLDPDETITRDAVDPVADSGLWQHLRDVPTMSIRDAAQLVAAVSDNLATNAVLQRVSLAAVLEGAQALGIEGVHLHDVVRHERRDEHPSTLASGTARSLALLCSRLHRDEVHGPKASATVRTWLSRNVDLSLVASAWGLDPLAHGPDDDAPRGIRTWNKTGVDIGVRADVGVASGTQHHVAYAVIAHWDGRPSLLAPVLKGMGEIGDAIGLHLTENDVTV